MSSVPSCSESIAPHNPLSSSVCLDFELFQNAIQSKNYDIIKNREGPLGLLSNGEHILHYSIRNGFHDLVEMLLKKGSKIDEKDAHGLTALDHALISDDSKMQALIIGHALEKPYQDILQFINKIPKFSWDVFKSGSQQFGDFRTTYTEIVNKILYSCTPKLCGILEIPRAASYLDFSTVGNIVKQEIPKICEAAHNKDYVKVEQLMVEGADINATMPNGWPVIYYAIQQENSTLVSFLLNKGAKIDFTESAGFSALHLAAAGNNLEIIQLLLQAGADPAREDKKGLTPIAYAMTNESLITTKFLSRYSEPSLSEMKILLWSTHLRKESRDQLGLKWNGLQWMLTSVVALSLFASMTVSNQKDASLIFALNTAVTVFSNALALSSTEGWKKKAGAIALLAIEAIPGIHMGVKIGARGYRAWHICKDSFKTITNCWQHRHLETFRPLRNSILSSIGAAYSLSHLFRVMEPKDWKNNRKVFCLDHNKHLHDEAVKAGKSHYSPLDCKKYDKIEAGIMFNEQAEKFNEFYTFTYLKSKIGTWAANLFGVTTPSESAFWKKEFTGEVPIDLCQGVDLGDCVRKTGLTAAEHPSQSMAILGISEESSIEEITKIAKELMLKYHPDKGGVTADPLLSGEIMAAKKLLTSLHQKPSGFDEIPKTFADETPILS